MRLVEHLHIAEILREAEENRQRSLSSGQDSEVALLSGARTGPNLGASGPTPSASTHDAVVKDSHTHKTIGQSPFSRVSMKALIFL